MSREVFFLCGVLLLWSVRSHRCFADVFAMPDGQRSLEMVPIDYPGNSPDRNGMGSVSYRYKLGKFEVTTAQYVEFLNAKGQSANDGGLWNNDMDKTLSGEGPRCQIQRRGNVGEYRYSVASEFANRPVTHVSFLDACRFCNWLHNGQGSGDTETGAYTLHGYWGTDGRRIQRGADAKYFVPNEDEWYKAAYYDAMKPGGAGYWKFPTRRDDRPNRDIDSENAANWFTGTFFDDVHFFSEVGAFSRSSSPSGTFDQAGNVFEWTDGLQPPFLRTLRGGAFDSDDAGVNLPTKNPVFSSMSDVGNVGFRIAAAIDSLPVAIANTATIGSDSSPQDFLRRPWRDPSTGRPFFPLAWFSYNSDEADLDELAQQGANLVLFVNSPSDVDSDQQTTDNIARMQQYLDHAQRRQIKVLVQTGGWYGGHMRQDATEIARQHRWIEAVRHHPALLGYQLYDEPEYRASFGLGVPDQRQLQAFVSGLQQTRTALKTWDPQPHRMTTTVFNLVPLSSWTEYLPTVDSFQVDRYPLDRDQAYFGHRGDWGPLMMAWSMAHGAAALRDHPHLKNPSPCMQGVGSEHTEGGTLGIWRNPLYDETRYMAYSSTTVGSWGIFHWIRRFGRPDNQVIHDNVGRLYHEFHTLLPAFEQSYEHPPFVIRHNHAAITRAFLTDSVDDITTLALEDDKHYYVIASNNSATFNDVQLRLEGLALPDTETRAAQVLNEGWSRSLKFSPETKDWTIDTHTMCFGDINVWVIDKNTEH